MPSKDDHRSWPREDYGKAHRARGFVHVNVHAYLHPHLNKSGQPFRLVPWLVHYAEVHFNLQKLSVSAVKHLCISADRPGTADILSFPVFQSQLIHMLNY